MAILTPLTVTGASGTTSSVVALPMARQNYNALGYALLVNFSGNPGSAATGTVSVQVSNDPNANPNLPTATQALARWNNHDTLFNLTTDKNSSIVFPCAYVRLIANATVTGTVTLGIGVPDGSNS